MFLFICYLLYDWLQVSPAELGPPASDEPPTLIFNFQTQVGGEVKVLDRHVEGLLRQFGFKIQNKILEYYKIFIYSNFFPKTF